MAVDVDPSSFFRRSWSLYDAIVESNHMGHREFYKAIGEELVRTAPCDTLLDLGCGNARCLAPVLRNAPPRSFVGVDLSEQALEEASRYLADQPRVELHCADLLEYCSNRVGSAGIVFSGFAVHHLAQVGKERLFRELFRLLPKNGFFLLLDVIREEGITREDHVLAYTEMMRNEWRDIPDQALCEGIEHVLQCDHPASFSELDCMALRVGFESGECLLIRENHALIRFLKS